MRTLARRFRSAGLATLFGLSIVLGGIGQGQAKEFEIDGLADCGVPSERRCSIDTTLVLWTDDISGTNQRVEVDVSWVRQALGAVDQDDHVCLLVEDRPGGRLQAIGVGQGCELKGTVNPGLSTDDRDVREQPRRKNEDDDDKQNAVVAVAPGVGGVPGPGAGAGPAPGPGSGAGPGTGTVPGPLSTDLSVRYTSPTIAVGDPIVDFDFSLGVARAANDVVLTLTIPAGTTFQGLSVEEGDEPGNFTCTTPPPGGTGVVTCTDPSVPAEGGGIFGFMRVSVPGGVRAGQTYSSTATATSSTPDPDPSNNTATSAPRPLPVASISGTPSVLEGTLPPGGGDGNTVQVTVTLSEPSSEQVIVQLGAQDETATGGAGNTICLPGRDYSSVFRTAEFAPGQTSVVANAATTCPDALPEPDETFLVRLTFVASGNATIAPGQVVRATIRNDD